MSRHLEPASIACAGRGRGLVEPSNGGSRAKLASDRLEMHAPGQSSASDIPRGRREWIVRRVDLRNRLRKGSADVTHPRQRPNQKHISAAPERAGPCATGGARCSPCVTDSRSGCLREWPPKNGGLTLGESVHLGYLPTDHRSGRSCQLHSARALRRRVQQVQIQRSPQTRTLPPASCPRPEALLLDPHDSVRRRAGPSEMAWENAGDHGLRKQDLEYLLRRSRPWALLGRRLNSGSLVARAALRSLAEAQT
jgi:hypothetical protein